MIYSTTLRSAAASHARFAPKLKSQPALMGITPAVVAKWVPTLGVWGVGAGFGVMLFASAIPIFQKDVLKKIPGIAGYYEDTTPASDKPF